MSEWTLKEHSMGDLVVTISGDEWKKECAKAYNKIAGDITIPGFRKGKAPKQILKKYITDEHIHYEAIEKNANRWMFDAMKENSLEPVSRPTLDVRSESNDSCELVFSFYVSPEVTLGQYTDLPYDLGDTSVSEEEITKEIDRMRNTYADIETTEEPAVDGDTLNIDYVGTKDGVEFEGGSAEGFSLVLGSGTFIPGFEDQLIGAKAGEEKELNLTFPEDYSSKDLAGQAVVFKVKVNEVNHKVLPDLDDDFVKDLSISGVETVEEYRKTVVERLENNKKSAAERQADDKLMETIRDNAEVEIPQPMIDSEVEMMVENTEQQMKQYGIQPKQYYQMMGTTAEALKENYRADAEKTVKLRLVLKAIAAKEGLSASDEELEQEYRDMAGMYGLEVEKIKAIADEGIVKGDIEARKAVDFVKEHAKKA